MGQPVNRRQALAGLGTVSLGALLAACGADGGGGDGATGESPRATTGAGRARGRRAELFDETSACTLTPESAEGPFYFDADAIRGDIAEDRDGVPLRLVIRVRGQRSCRPLRNAVVDVWHCDAGGRYSGFEAGPGPGGRTDGERYLRGAQVTDGDGIVEFRTIYPGWYPGRTVHVHAKVHLDRRSVLTTQLNFDDDVSATVFRRPPYSQRPGRDTFNDDDAIFDRRTLLDLRRDRDGYVGVISFDVAAA